MNDDVPSDRNLDFGDDPKDHFFAFASEVITEIAWLTSRATPLTELTHEIFAVFYNTRTNPADAAREFIARMGWAAEVESTEL